MTRRGEKLCVTDFCIYICMRGFGNTVCACDWLSVWAHMQLRIWGWITEYGITQHIFIIGQLSASSSSSPVSLSWNLWSKCKLMVNTSTNHIRTRLKPLIRLKLIDIYFQTRSNFRTHLNVIYKCFQAEAFRSKWMLVKSNPSICYFNASILSKYVVKKTLIGPLREEVKIELDLTMFPLRQVGPFFRNWLKLLLEIWISSWSG